MRDGQANAAGGRRRRGVSTVSCDELTITFSFGFIGKIAPCLLMRRINQDKLDMISQTEQNISPVVVKFGRSIVPSEGRQQKTYHLTQDCSGCGSLWDPRSSANVVGGDTEE